MVVKRGRGIVLVGLAVWLVMAGPGFAQEAAPNPGAAAEKPNNVGEMRDWLNRRAQERKKLGLPGADMVKTHVASVHPHPRPGAKVEEAEPGRLAPAPVPPTGRGPDGRIHHRLLINEDGPDQLQVYTPSGYSAPASAEDAAKLARLTARGKRAWMAGSSLRDPGAYLSAQKAEQKGQ